MEEDPDKNLGAWLRNLPGPWKGGIGVAIGIDLFVMLVVFIGPYRDCDLDPGPGVDANGCTWFHPHLAMAHKLFVFPWFVLAAVWLAQRVWRHLRPRNPET